MVTNITKWVATIIAYHQKQKSRHFYPLYLGIRVNDENTVLEQHFTHIEKGQSKIGFNSGHWSPMATGMPTPTPSCATEWRTSSSPHRRHIYWWDWPGAMWHTLKQIKGIHIESETRKGNRSSTAWENSLSLCKKVFQAWGQKVVERLHAQGCLSRHILHYLL